MDKSTKKIFQGMEHLLPTNNAMKQSQPPSNLTDQGYASVVRRELLLAFAVLAGLFIILVGLAIIDSNTAILDDLASSITGYFVN